MSDGFELTSRAWEVRQRAPQRACIPAHTTSLVSIWDTLRGVRVYPAGKYPIYRTGSILLITQIMQGYTLSQRFRRLRKSVLSQRRRMDPPMERKVCYSATHPSDHNSVSANSRVVKQRREMWKVRWQHRGEKDGLKTKKPQGKGKGKDLEERRAKSQDDYEHGLSCSNGACNRGRRGR